MYFDEKRWGEPQEKPPPQDHTLLLCAIVPIPFAVLFASMGVVVGRTSQGILFGIAALFAAFSLMGLYDLLRDFKVKRS